MGKLSSGKAAEMAGTGRVAFLHKLGPYGFPTINLDNEQINAELRAAAEQRATSYNSPLATSMHQVFPVSV